MPSTSSCSWNQVSPRLRMRSHSRLVVHDWRITCCPETRSFSKPSLHSSVAGGGQNAYRRAITTASCASRYNPAPKARAMAVSKPVSCLLYALLQPGLRLLLMRTECARRRRIVSNASPTANAISNRRTVDADQATLKSSLFVHRTRKKDSPYENYIFMGSSEMNCGGILFPRRGLMTKGTGRQSVILQRTFDYTSLAKAEVGIIVENTASDLD